MAHTPLEIFRVIILHNKLLAEGDFKIIAGQSEDPEEIINKMLAGELISESTANKVMALYQRNLEKSGLAAPEAKSAGASGGGTAVATPPAAPSHPAPVSHPSSESHPAPAAHVPSSSATKSASATATAAPKASASPPPIAQAMPTVSVEATPITVGSGGKEFIFKLLLAARAAKASDLHIKSGAIPVVRVASTLREMPMEKISPDICEQSLLSILDDRQRETFLTKKDLDFSFDGGLEMGRFRGNYMREHRGMDGVFRLIAGRVPSFEELKLPEQIKKFTTYRQGIVIITGPKGSGKTTTLAALIDLINANRAEHIITIEDPIEFVHPCKKGHVNQREVGPHTDSFSNALRAALREAPDVIMVGEMRDLETIGLAITAAETGHLVFGTLHTPDAARTIGRVLDVFPPKEQGQIRAMFSESLRGIVSQHLIPSMDGESMQLATEIMFNTSAIGNLIRDNRAFQLKGIMQTGKKLGMVLMDESLLKLVKEKKIPKEEALARADNLPMMEKDLAGFH